MTTQTVPIKLYRSTDRITVAAPMPGLGPEDIQVRVDDRGHVVLEGRLCERADCGALEGSTDVLTEEWTVGPYLRELDVPDAVDAEAGIVTYGNCVLVVSLPFADTTRPATLWLERVRPDRGANAARPNTDRPGHYLQRRRAAGSGSQGFALYASSDAALSKYITLPCGVAPITAVALSTVFPDVGSTAVRA